MTSLILILKYNLHAIMNLEILSGTLSNTCSLATPVLAPCALPLSYAVNNA